MSEAHTPLAGVKRARTDESTASTSPSLASSSTSPSGLPQAGGAGSVPSDHAVHGPTGKRLDYLSWDDYFMSVAFLSAMRSKDPSTQVGACIVDSDQRIVGIGYNGFPRGVDDDALPWARSAASELDTKYPYVCHAEMNAILNRNNASLKGCKIYVALFPCNECSKLIVQSGIVEVVYFSDKYHDSPNVVASRRLLDLAKVTYRQHVPKDSTVNITFK